MENNESYELKESQLVRSKLEAKTKVHTTVFLTLKNAV